MNDINEKWVIVKDVTDPRLQPFLNLRERTLRGESIFIAEGSLVVERLLRSQFLVESVLITRKESGWGNCLELLSKDVPVYYIDEKIIADKLLGFEFHQGILALGRRRIFPTLIQGLEIFFEKYIDDGRRHAWIVLPNATKPDNLGLVFRCAAAFGVEAVVLGEQCCDPLSRRALRVSMGGVLQTSIYQAKNILLEINEARKRWKIPFYATVLDEQAISSYKFNDVLNQSNFGAFVFGNEYSGMSQDEIAACDYKLTIPMRPDVDSLNLGVSAGIFLYEFNRPCDNLLSNC